MIVETQIAIFWSVGETERRDGTRHLCQHDPTSRGSNSVSDELSECEPIPRSRTRNRIKSKYWRRADEDRRS